MQFSNDTDGLTNLIFAPDPVSRFQYEKVHEARKGLADQHAVRDLMRAVLEDGIACYQVYFFKPSRTNEKLSLEAEEWINSNDDGVFSFNNICETLGLNAGRLRRGLERWKAKQIQVSLEKRRRLIPNKGKCCGKEKSHSAQP